MFPIGLSLNNTVIRKKVLLREQREKKTQIYFKYSSLDVMENIQFFFFDIPFGIFSETKRTRLYTSRWHTIVLESIIIYGLPLDYFFSACV